MTKLRSTVSTALTPGVLAEPLSVEGVDDNDAEGYVPLDILNSGTRIVIPLWADPGPNDQLWVLWLQSGVETRIVDRTYPAIVVDPFIYEPLTPAQMSLDGEAFVSYRVWKRGGGNFDDSPSRKLTIDHAPLLVLAEPSFPHSTLWGYLNNKTEPPLIVGVTVRIPPAIGIALPGDRNEVYWTGYRSLNGSGDPVQGTQGVWSRILSSDDVNNGYELVVPFEIYVRPLIDNDSALVFCRLYRGGRLVAMSKKGLVRIDRVTPGESGPTGLSTKSMNEGVTEMRAKLQPPKARANAVSTGIVTVDAAINDKLADDSIPVSVLDSGLLIFTATNLADPQDGDELEIYYTVVGGTEQKVPGYFDMELIAGRPDPFEMEVDASLFPEAPTPADPTRYEVRYELYKGGGGNKDDSTIVEFAIDRTAPFEVKVPARLKNKPTPDVTMTNRPAGPGYVLDEAWITTNPKMLCTVPVGYPLRRLDDVLSYYLSSGTTVLKVFEGTVDATGSFDVDSAELRNLPNLTRVSHAYEWKDLPGNLSARSDARPLFDLRLAQDPELLEPKVPKTDPNRTVPLYLDDFVTGSAPVLAIVEQPLHGLSTDEIELFIEDASDSLVFESFGKKPLGTANVEFTLDYVKLARLFDDSTQPKEVKVWYEHTRVGSTPLDSPVIYIFLNFVYAGPGNPDLPDLINPDLQLVTVKGASNTSNIITPGDRNSPGTISVPVWFGLPDLVGGEQVDFYINGTLVDTFLPFGGESELVGNVTAAFIKALPTATVKAYWTIKYVGSNNNIIKSPEQDVVVNAQKIDLLPPTIRMRTRDEISCFAMDNPVTAWTMAMGIPKDATNLPPGKNITVHFVGVTDITGTAEVPGTADSQPYVIKAADQVDIAQVGTADKFKLNQPFRGAIAFGKYWYETDINGTQSSEVVIKLFDIINTSFEYCDRMDAPAPTP
ncbi:hypothetical protein [Pseudomonas sp. Z4-20]|uniref:hypothetical protein n=1 Tax=Pseudomonas sp. Z4-20 TaxID=2817414 RepID=UPI003DAA496F